MHPSARSPRQGFAAAMAAALLVCGAAAWAQQRPAPPAAAQMAGLQVRQDELERMLRALPPADRSAVRQNSAAVAPLLRQRLASEALLREAHARQWAERPEVRRSVDAAVQEVTARIVGNSYLASVTQLPDAYPSPQEMAAAYAQARPSLAIPEQFRIAQILLVLPPGADAGTEAQVRAQAEDLARQARTGDFAALARQHSQDAASAARGGEVGTFALAGLLPQARDTVAAMQAGQISEPVRSPTGLHILRLLDRQPARTAALNEVEPRLRALLREQRQQALARAYLDKLAPETSVAIDAAVLEAAVRNVID